MRPATTTTKPGVPDFTGHTAMSESKDQLPLARAHGSAYESVGRNPCWQLCCGTCAHLIKDQQYPTHGWCPIHNNASVSLPRS